TEVPLPLRGRGSLQAIVPLQVRTVYPTYSSIVLFNTARSSVCHSCRDIYRKRDSTVSRDFNYVTAIMYAKLKLVDIFPSKSMVIEYMPLPFRFGNKDVRIIVDCTEFPIQKPSSNN
ncbi:hypothetical protein NPIL_38411, partial [Nephila pilipes]